MSLAVFNEVGTGLKLLSYQKNLKSKTMSEANGDRKGAQSRTVLNRFQKWFEPIKNHLEYVLRTDCRPIQCSLEPNKTMSEANATVRAPIRNCSKPIQEMA